MIALRITQTLAALLACLLIGTSADAESIKAVQIGTFESPVYVAVAAGEHDLLFVVEQPGQIQVLRNEQKQGAPFLDIRNLVLAPPDPGAGGEQGLLSIAFPPSYPQTGLFYAFFVNTHSNLELDEFKRSANRLRADPASRRILLTINHSAATNHNGGQMQFGPGGYLFISTGDGGNLSPPGEPARSIASLLGKILRIDPFHHTGSLHYAIPPTNPFVGHVGRDEIYAYGFRNPWRFSFDDGRIAVGDVGQSQQEEVDFLTAGAASGMNFGWPQYEGRLVFDASRPGPGQPKFPIFTYGHTGGRCAIIGGYVVHDANMPSLTGRYLYGDACTGELRSFVPNVAAQTVAGDRPAGIVLPGLSGFGRGFGNHIYAAQISGAVSRIAPSTP